MFESYSSVFKKGIVHPLGLFECLPANEDRAVQLHPFGQRTFVTRPPSKAEDMGLSQGYFASFLEEKVKEALTSIHVNVESTKSAEVYTTGP